MPGSGRRPPHQIRSCRDVCSMSGLPESGQGWAIYMSTRPQTRGASTCAVDERLSRHLPFPDSYRWESGTQSRNSGPILRHRSGPSSQLSGPIAGFLAWDEDAQRHPTPMRPLSPAGAYRFAPDPNCKMEKSTQRKCERRETKAIHKF
jgi:hypothetical protein